MLNFKEYMISRPNFDDLIQAADDAIDEKKYHHAWEFVNQAIPRNEEEASIKAMYLDKLRMIIKA